MIAKTLSTSARFASLYDVAGKLAEFCQSLYPLLVSHSDDSGRQQGDVFTVKHAVHPTSPRPLTDFEKALSSLDRVRLIDWYEVDGRKFIQINNFHEHQPGLKDRGNSKIPAMPGNAAKVTACREMPSEENRTEENRTEENSADAVLATVPTDRDPTAPEGKLEAVVLLWNDSVAESKLPQVRGLSDKRRTHIRARLKEHPIGVMAETFKALAASPFANGQNSRNWVITFDWLMESPTNLLKAVEGNYNARAPASATGTEGARAVPDVERTRNSSYMRMEFGKPPAEASS